MNVLAFALDNSGCFYIWLSRRIIMKGVRVNIFCGNLGPVLGKLESSTFDKKE